MKRYGEADAPLAAMELFRGLHPRELRTIGSLTTRVPSASAVLTCAPLKEVGGFTGLPAVPPTRKTTQSGLAERAYG